MSKNDIVTRVIEKFLGFDDYKAIIKSFRNVDISQDGEFQKLFNHYYEVR